MKVGRPRIYPDRSARDRAYYQRRKQRTESCRYPRHEFDLYVTPREVIDACLDVVTIEPRSILDIGANDGRWGQLAKLRWPEAFLAGVDLRELPKPESFDRWYCGDFIEGARWLPSFDLLLGNPPYNVAEGIVRGALSLRNRGGEVLFLLQSQFAHGQARRLGLFAEHPLRRLYPLAARVSYHSGQGGTRDATAFLWKEGYQGPEELFRGRY